VGTPWAARRKNDDSPRNLRYLTFSESFHWLIAKTQTQEPIRSLENLETRFFFRAILANQRHGKRANGYFGCTESATSKLQVPDGVLLGGSVLFIWGWSCSWGGQSSIDGKAALIFYPILS
jgi:hypothetical protein